VVCRRSNDATRNQKSQRSIVEFDRSVRVVGSYRKSPSPKSFLNAWSIVFHSYSRAVNEKRGNAKDFRCSSQLFHD